MGSSKEGAVGTNEEVAGSSTGEMPAGAEEDEEGAEEDEEGGEDEEVVEEFEGRLNEYLSEDDTFEKAKGKLRYQYKGY